MLGQERLVGRDDVLARRQRGEHIVECRLGSAHRLDNDVDVGVVDHLRHIRRQPDAVQAAVTRLFQVAHGRPGPANSAAGPAGDPVGVLGQEASHTGSHGSQADHADGDVFHSQAYQA